MSRIAYKDLRRYAGNGLNYYEFGGEYYCCRAGAEAYPQPCVWHDDPERLRLDNYPLPVGSPRVVSKSNKSLDRRDSRLDETRAYYRGVIIGVLISLIFWAPFIIWLTSAR